MKYLIVFLALGLSLSAQAKSRRIAQVPKDNVLVKIKSLAEGLVANGDVSSVRPYDLKNFDPSEEQKRALIDFINMGGCADGGIKPRANIDSNMQHLKVVTDDANGASSNPNSASNQMLGLVKSLKDQKKLSAFFSVSWDEKEEATESVDGESCSMYLFRIFTTEGKKLTLFFSNTD